MLRGRSFCFFAVTFFGFVLPACSAKRIFPAPRPCWPNTPLAFCTGSFRNGLTRFWTLTLHHGVL